MSEITKAALEVVKQETEAIKDLVGILLPPSGHAMITKRRFKNALASLEEVKEELKKMGLEIDYKTYFEKQLKIPLLLVESLANEEEPSLREILKKLFINHLSQKYEDDSLYPAFISIIKDLTSIDIDILQKFHNLLMENNKWANDEFKPSIHRDTLSGIAKQLFISEQTVKASWENLERCKIITTVYPVRSVTARGMPNAVIGPPSLTAFGVLFIQACIEETKWSDHGPGSL